MEKDSSPPLAVALEYDGVNAPSVTATGERDIAEQIVQIAKENNIPIHENAELVALLAKIDLGDEIPEVLYQVVAHIIAFVYHLQGKIPTGFRDDA